MIDTTLVRFADTLKVTFSNSTTCNHCESSPLNLNWPEAIVFIFFIISVLGCYATYKYYKNEKSKQGEEYKRLKKKE